MAKIRRIDFSPDEWLSGTAELSMAERGIYITACTLMYSRGGPIEEILLRAFCPGDARAYRNALDRLVAAGKLDLSDGHLSNKRCLSELQVSAKRIATATQNGAKGGRPSNKPNGLDKPSGFEDGKTNHQPSTINHQPSTRRKNPPRKPPQGDFGAWWDAYPHKVGKRAAEKAYRSALARASPIELASGIASYIASKPPDREWCNPATWLNQNRWQDEPATIPQRLTDGHSRPTAANERFARQRQATLDAALARERPLAASRADADCG